MVVDLHLEMEYIDDNIYGKLVNNLDYDTGLPDTNVIYF